MVAAAQAAYAYDPAKKQAQEAAHDNEPGNEPEKTPQRVFIGPGQEEHTGRNSGKQEGKGENTHLVIAVIG
jgi:hypothetical protein